MVDSLSEANQGSKEDPTTTAIKDFVGKYASMMVGDLNTLPVPGEGEIIQTETTRISKDGRKSIRFKRSNEGIISMTAMGDMSGTHFEATTGEEGTRITASDPSAKRFSGEEALGIAGKFMPPIPSGQSQG